MIGFFDSGSGGLSVLKAFRALSPDADIVYFGDIRNAPYGTKSARELEDIARAGIALLKEKGATHIVAACNSVSPAMLAGAAGEMPVVEMSLPFAASLGDTPRRRLLLLATPATIASGLYQHAIADAANIDPLPIADLAGVIEFGAPEWEAEVVVHAALATRLGERYDGIVLGCTHYPLARGVIERVARVVFGIAPVLIDPAEAVAREAVSRFDTRGEGRSIFHISQDSQPFRDRVETLFGDVPIHISL